MLKHNSKKIDNYVFVIICALLLYSTIILFAAFMDGENIGEWIWNRHQNQFSWYSRPLFMIPAAYFAYRNKIFHVIGILILLATSLFWFEAPAVVSPAVSEFLEWERNLFFDSSIRFPLVALSLAVLIFLFLFFYAFWKRNPWYGLILINVGTILKIVVSILLGQETGQAVIIPSLSSILIINVVAFVIWRYKRKL